MSVSLELTQQLNLQKNELTKKNNLLLELQTELKQNKQHQQLQNQKINNLELQLKTEKNSSNLQQTRLDQSGLTEDFIPKQKFHQENEQLIK